MTVPAAAELDAAKAGCHTLRMTNRINARITPELAEKVEFLRKRTGGSVTDVLSASIERYFEQVAQAESSEALFEGFIGCAHGPANIAADYKQLLAESFRKKAPQ